MREMTKANLSAAFAGESQAHMKYKAFADRAAREGFGNVSRLFQAISYAEQVHATNHLKALGELKGTTENLESALGGEVFEVNEMYPSYIAVAEMEQEKQAVRSQNWALEAEKTHMGLYDQARKSVAAGNDATLGVLQVCSNCGWTVVGEAPDVCPVCKAKKEAFVAF